MNYVDLLNYPVNYVTTRNVLELKNLRQDIPNVVLRHDYDDLRNWHSILAIEKMYGKVSSNYLLMNKYPVPKQPFKQFENEGFEFGLHQNFMDSGSLEKEILEFEQLGLELTSMMPHGWADNDGEYPMYGNWEVDENHQAEPYSMNMFYAFCEELFGPYEKRYNVARYYSKSGKSFFDFPYRGILTLDDSGGQRKPYNEHNVLKHMKPSKVYMFLIHPSNLNGLSFLEYPFKWRIKWNT